MERLTDHENEYYNQPGCNSCSDYRWRSCKESGEIDDCIQRLTWLRLLDIEDILGDEYDLDRLRELVEADRDGRCHIGRCVECTHYEGLAVCEFLGDCGGTDWICGWFEPKRAEGATPKGDRHENM